MGSSDSSAASGDTDSEESSEGEETGSQASCAPQVDISGPEAGDLFVDGLYTGTAAPGLLDLASGAHRIAIGTPNGYFTRSIEIESDAEPCELILGDEDRLEAREWKALYVDIPSLRGVENGCQVDASQAELDAMYDFFQDNMHALGSTNSYQTMSWNITRVAAAGTVDVGGGAGDYTLNPSDLGPVFDDLSPGDYDTIFVGWKAQGADCVLDAWYVGLGWTPQAETKQMGFANLRLQADDIVAHVQSLASNDPGGFLHEFLHTVEVYYAQLGANMPDPAGGFPLHAAEVYGYSFPWLTWYEDFMRGKVEDTVGGGYRGITPELMHGCTTRDAVLTPESCG
jgi:hypothetical protein